MCWRGGVFSLRYILPSKILVRQAAALWVNLLHWVLKLQSGYVFIDVFLMSLVMIYIIYMYFITSFLHWTCLHLWYNTACFFHLLKHACYWEVSLVSKPWCLACKVFDIFPCFLRSHKLVRGNNKFGNVYSLECTDIPKVLFVPHHIVHCCIPVIV